MTAPKPFRCTECGHRFSSERALEQHMHDAHFRISGTEFDAHLRDAFCEMFGADEGEALMWLAPDIGAK